MMSVDSNFNFLCGRPHGPGPPPPSTCVHLSLTSLPLRVDVINGWPLIRPTALQKRLCQLLLASKIELLSNDLNSWMSSNRLSLNSAKTQLIWFGTPQQLLKLDHALLSDRFPHFTFHTSVHDLG